VPYLRQSLCPHLAGFAALLLVAIPEFTVAADGVAEINQACAVETGCFFGDSPAFPVTIITPGSYRPTSNLTVAGVTEAGIEVRTSEVTLDLRGFAMKCATVCSSSTPCSSAGFNRGIDATQVATRSVTVRDGSIGDFGGSGIHLGDESVVRHVRLTRNGGAGISGGINLTIEGNVAGNNFGGGILVGNGARIRRNISADNGANGISAGRESRVLENIARGSEGVGIVVGPGSLVTSNSASRNGSEGILFDTEGLVAGTGKAQWNSVALNEGHGLRFAEVAFFGRDFGAYQDNFVHSNSDGEASGGTDLGGNF